MKYIPKLYILVIVLLGAVFLSAGAQADELVLPANITVVEEGAFCGDSSLDTVVLPEGLLSIQSKAFADSSVTVINLPNSLEYIAEDAFELTGIRKAIVEEDSYACQWARAHGLKTGVSDDYDESWDPSVEEESEEDPDDVFRFIRDSEGVHITAYTGKRSCVTIPAELDGTKVVSVCLNASENKYRITKVVLPPQPIALDDNAFAYLRNLSSVEGLEYVCSLGRYLFLATSLRNSMVFSEALKTISQSAFEGSILQEIVIPSDVQYEEGAFVAYYLKKITLTGGSGEATVQLKDGVLFSADGSTLISCPAMKDGTSYTVPEETSRIATYAFITGTKLTEMTIPASVSEISPDAFKQVMEPTDIVVTAGSPAHQFAVSLAAKDKQVRVIVQGDGQETLAQLVRRIVQENASTGSDYEKALALHDWLIDYASYDFRESGIAITTGAGMLLNGTGVCAAYASAYRMLLEEAGIECRVVGNATHAFVAVKIGNDWMYVDCTWDDMSGDAKLNHTYFGFEDTIRYAVYGASDPDTSNDVIVAPETQKAANYKLHYWYRKGYCSSEIAGAKTAVQQKLDAGKERFTISAQGTDGVSGPLVAAALSGTDWTANGGKWKLSCSWNDGKIYCCVLQSAVSTEYEYDVRNNMIRILKYNGSKRIVTIPAKMNGLPVGYIGPAFFGNTTVASVFLPDTIVEIEGNAFRNAAALQKINFPRNLKTIGDSAFAFCTALSSDVALPSGFRSLGMLAFQQCTSIRAVSLPADTVMDDMAFLDCTGITTVNLADGIKALPHSAFSGCTALTAVTLPDSLEEIGNNAFYETAITELNIPKNVYAIGDSPIQECQSLTALTVDPDNPWYKSEDNIVFSKDGRTIFFSAECAGEADYTVPEGVTTLYSRAFCGNQKIVRLVIPGTVKTIGNEVFTGAFDPRGTALESVVIQEGCKTIGMECFRDCPRLTELQLPDSVTLLGRFAFINTPLNELHIPARITVIPEGLFSGEAKKVYIHENVTGAEIYPYSMETTVYGKSGTFAETFAGTYGMPFVATE